MNTVTMYSTQVCPYCVRAAELLRQKGVQDWVKIAVDESPAALAEMQQRTGRRTVPQIFIGERHVGGWDDLQALAQQGVLETLLRA